MFGMVRRTGVYTDENLCPVPIANSSLKGSSNWDDFI